MARTNIPLLLIQSGICVFPITSLGLDHKGSDQAHFNRNRRVSDNMFGRKLSSRDASVLLSGTA